MTHTDESDALHARVQAFALGAHDDFDSLALDIARFQARYSPGFQRLVDAARSPLDTVASIPAVPCEAFRLTRVAVHPEHEDEARFYTSGTTGEARGMHAMRRTDTYRLLSTELGRHAMAASWQRRPIVVALARPSASSSLAFMMAELMTALDGRSLDGDAASAGFDVRDERRWLLGSDGVDEKGLELLAELAHARGEPLLVLTTSFALVALLDTLRERSLPLPEQSVVMQTGGYKGKGRAVEPEWLIEAAARSFGLDPARVVGEYGMTELTSQLYEGTLPGGTLQGERGVYLEPQWLKVTPVDPVTLHPVPDGSLGVARIIDLGNVDSAVAIVTGDLVRRRGGGIELCGRLPGAIPRGCSLAVEALLEGAS